MWTIELPLAVTKIINRLEQNGFEAYIVGGCVRDALLGFFPYDWDITTSAQPDEVKKMFERTVDTGLEHGTVTVLEQGNGYEVTTYRIDGKYEDNRRPSEVVFSRTLEEDLKRRDFTINAMAYHPERGLVDMYGGVNDLERKLIRCVGDPIERFSEDALRMLRALRFAAKFEYRIDKDTVKGIKTLSHLIQAISAERIHVELTKILCSDHPEYMKYLAEFGLMAYIMPEFLPNIGLKQNNPYHCYSVDEHTYACMRAVEQTEVLRWTMLLHDIGKGYHHTIGDDGYDHFYGHGQTSIQHAKKILNRLKFDNKSKNRILKLIEFHDYRLLVEEKAVRRGMQKVGVDLFLDYIKVQRGDISGQHPDKFSERWKILDQIEALYHLIIEKQQCVTLKQLQITGFDLQKIGIAQGKRIGEVLQWLLEQVIEEPQLNEKEQLIRMALEYDKKNDRD